MKTLSRRSCVVLSPLWFCWFGSACESLLLGELCVHSPAQLQDAQQTRTNIGRLSRPITHVGRLTESAHSGVATFTLTPSGTMMSFAMTVTGMELARVFVNHVLPSGFHKIRHHGWQHPGREMDVEETGGRAWRRACFFCCGLRLANAPNLCPQCGGVALLRVCQWQY